MARDTRPKCRCDDDRCRGGVPMTWNKANAHPRGGYWKCTTKARLNSARLMRKMRERRKLEASR